MLLKKMKLKKKISILITCVGGELSPTSIKFLKKNPNYNIKVVGTDLNNNAIGKYFCDKFYKVPKSSSKNYVKNILKIATKNKINIIIPTSDEETLALSKKKEVFEKKKIYLLSSNYQTLKIFSNKEETYKTLSKLGIDKIRFDSIKNKKLFMSFFKKKRNNLVVKPAVSRGGRGIFIIKNIKKEKAVNFGREVHLNIKTFKKKYLSRIKIFPQIISEIYEPPVYDLDVLSYKGDLKKIILRKRIISEEPNSGHEFCNVPKNLVSKIKALCKKLKLNALHDVDLMKNKDGEFKILEVNPRPSGSVAVTCVAGINLFRDVIKMYLNIKIKKQIGIKNKNIKIIPTKNLIKKNISGRSATS